MYIWDLIPKMLNAIQNIFVENRLWPGCVKARNIKHGIGNVQWNFFHIVHSQQNANLISININTRLITVSLVLITINKI